MANTKNITDVDDRKAKKRELRKAFKAEYAKLTPKQRNAYRRSETVGLRKWLSEQDND